ncbi:MAG: hypothetical protein JXQ99_15085 [Hyphomicrobiaceae bacterium]
MFITKTLEMRGEETVGDRICRGDRDRAFQFQILAKNFAFDIEDGAFDRPRGIEQGAAGTGWLQSGRVAFE